MPDHAEADVPACGAGPWTGIWKWVATWDTGDFIGTGMELFQPPDGELICAEWGWSGGGFAWGMVTGDVWNAQWDDHYGSGTWKLTLSPGGLPFSGTQNVIADSPFADSFVPDIVGFQTSGSGPRLDCSEIASLLRHRRP